MQDDSSRPHQFDSRLGLDPRTEGALLHSERREILAHLVQKREGRGTGARGLADEFGLNDPLVEYHLGVLQRADLIVRVEDERERGGAERSYVASAAAGRGDRRDSAPADWTC